MARYLILAAVLIATAFADDGYAAPSGGYAAPSGGYAAPNDGYSAQSSGYGAPTAPADGYGAPADNYGAPAYNEPTGYAVAAPSENTDIFNLEKIIYLIPFFLAVLAAIIIAQIIAPLIGLLFNAKVGLINSGIAGLTGVAAGAGGLAGVGTIPIDLLNAVLTPFNLSICTIIPLEVVGSGTAGRGFNLDPAMIQSAATLLYNAYESKSKFILI